MCCKRRKGSYKRLYPGGAVAPDDPDDTDGNDVTDEAYTESQLNAKTKAELLEIAAELGIEGVSDSNTKAEIISAILEAQG